jgi:hypothetical protein
MKEERNPNCLEYAIVIIMVIFSVAAMLYKKVTSAND